MQERDLIKAFKYGEEWRDDLVFSGTDIYLESTNSERGVMLRKDSDGDYPVTGEQYVRHRVTEPLALQSWEGFDYEAVEPTGTALAFRISDGTDDYWWDGGTWVVVTPDPAEWNTRQEIHDHIAGFRAAVSSRKLQVVTRLTTTDPSLTPRLTTTKLLYRAWINFTEDLILRSFVPTLKAQIRPWKDSSFKAKSATDTFALGEGGAYTLRPYRVEEIVGVWDHDNDPQHLVSLFDSYDTGTEIMTLTSAVASGTRLFMTFKYAPRVSVAKHPDYIEVEDDIPSLTLEGLRAVLKMRGSPARRDAIINRADFSAKVVASVDATTFDLDILVSADRNTDRFRLSDAVRDFLEDNPLLNLVGVDEDTPVRLLQDPSFSGRPENSGLLQETITVRFDRVHYFPQAKDRYSVNEMNVALTQA